MEAAGLEALSGPSSAWATASALCLPKANSRRARASRMVPKPKVIARSGNGV